MWNSSSVPCFTPVVGMVGMVGIPPGPRHLPLPADAGVGAPSLSVSSRSHHQSTSPLGLVSEKKPIYHLCLCLTFFVALMILENSLIFLRHHSNGMNSIPPQFMCVWNLRM